MVLQQINETLEYLQENLPNLHSDELSRIEIKLSILMASLGEITANAGRVYNDAEAYRKFSFAEEWNKTRATYINQGVRVTNTEVENEVVVKTQKYSKIENEAEEQYNKLKYLLDTIPQIINSIKDRLKVLEREQRSNMGA